jgi:hypothetical protein
MSDVQYYIQFLAEIAAQLTTANPDAGKDFLMWYLAAN